MVTLDSKIISIRRRFRNRSPYYGFYSDVAREWHTWPSHVRRVYFGMSTSRRVAEAILTTVERWDSERKDRRAA
jgi:hypothetical protein